MIKTLLAIASLTLLAPHSSQAALLQWQAAVGEGAAPSTVNFTSVTAPVLIDVGTLSGDRSFEFIVRADLSLLGASAAILGTFNVDSGKQGLKVKQWEGAANTGAHIGATAFGVLDHLSPINFPTNTDTHLVFTSDGIDTKLFLNGTLVHTFPLALNITGVQGLGGIANASNTLDGVIDPLTGGTIYGFASFDSALGDQEVATHYAAFIAPVPEPGSLGLAAVAGLAGLARRRRGRP